MSYNIKQLQEGFEASVNRYVDAFCELFEISRHDTWWVNNEIGLDLFCFGDIYAISLEDMVYCINNSVSYEEFVDFTDYNVQCLDFNLPTLNLRSWHMGAPRVSEDRFKLLKSLRNELMELTEKTKNEVCPSENEKG